VLSDRRIIIGASALLMVVAGFVVWGHTHRSDTPPVGQMRLSSDGPVRPATAAERRQAAAVVREFATALRHHQHAALCAMLTERTAQDVVRNTADVVAVLKGRGCAFVLASATFANPNDLPPAFHDAADHDIASVRAQRDGDLQVTFQHGYGHGWTLRRRDGEWKIMDAALLPPTVEAAARAQFDAWSRAVSRK
jgi:hypothetical protein